MLRKPLQKTKKRETNDDFFFIKGKNEKFNLIKIDEIVLTESLQNYISIQTIDRKVIAHLTLSKIKEKLKDKDQLLHVHRSFIISKKYSAEIEQFHSFMGTSEP